MNQPQEHYFSENSKVPFKPVEIEAELAGEIRKVVTAGGVFSPDGLDRGTKVLLQNLELAPSGNVLDMGCGWGAISLHTALENSDSTIYAIDINERARNLTATNAKKLGLKNIIVTSPDEIAETVLFDEIRSNPPIRVGKEALHALLKKWLPRLKPGGTAYLVVAKHLGADSLAKWIAAQWPDFSVDRYARSKGFHVIKIISSDIQDPR